MSLINAIQQVPDWQNKTAAEILTALQAETIPFIDPQQWTWAGVALVAGPDGAEGLRMALDANQLGWAVHQLGGSGLQLSADSVQPILYAFAQAGVPNMEALARYVKRNISVIERDNLGSVTVEMVGVAAEKQKRIDLATDRLQSYREAIASWDGAGEGPVL